MITTEENIVAHAVALSDRRSVSPLVDVVAGSLGGIAGTIVGQPFDVVKVCLSLEFP